MRTVKVRESLAELGPITRETETSIKVKSPRAKGAIRLKELLCEREFSPGLIEDMAAEKARGSGPDAEVIH